MGCSDCSRRSNCRPAHHHQKNLHIVGGEGKICEQGARDPQKKYPGMRKCEMSHPGAIHKNISRKIENGCESPRKNRKSLLSHFRKCENPRPLYGIEATHYRGVLHPSRVPFEQHDLFHSADLRNLSGL